MTTAITVKGYGTFPVGPEYDGLDPAGKQAYAKKLITEAPDAAAPEAPEAPVPPGNATKAFGPGPVSGALDTMDDATTGVGQGITLGAGDEINAGLATPFRAIGRKVMAGDWSPPSLSDYGDAYDTELQHQRDIIHGAHKRSPIATTGGELMGGLALGGPASKATTVPGLAWEGIKQAAPMGAAYGFMSGEGTGDRLTQGAVGGALGGAAGVAMPVASAVARRVARPALELYKRLRDPEQAASDVVAKGIMPDRDAGNAMLDDTAFALAQKRNQPVTNVQRGGETTVSLARSLANRSGVAADTIAKGFKGQVEDRGSRLTDFIKNLAGGNDLETATKTLKAQADFENSGNYNKSFYEGDRPILTPRMKQLVGTKEVQQAMKDAVEGVRTQAVLAKTKFKPTVALDKQGNLVFKKNVQGNNIPPNLQYWDAVKRELQKAGEKASSATEKSHYFQLADEIKKSLYRYSPTYKHTLEKASAAFGERDAGKAGASMFRIGGKGTNWRSLASAHAQYTPAEKKMFAVGFADQAKQMLDKAGDKEAALKTLWGSADARNRARIALGASGAKELEAIMHVENAIERLRRGAFGGSQHLKQSLAVGLALGEGENMLEGNPFSLQGAFHGALIGLAREQHLKINAKVINRAAEMLMSNDPALFQRGIKAAANDKRLMSLIRMLSLSSRTAAGQQGSNLGSSQ